MVQLSLDRGAGVAAAATATALKSARGYVLVGNVPKGATGDHMISFFEGYSVLRAGMGVLKETLRSPAWTVLVQFKSKAAGEDAVVISHFKIKMHLKIMDPFLEKCPF
jgi:hypothetical protein